jgi:hypothetical protein
MAFSASKAAVIQLTRDLGVHLARSRVRVNSVSLGPIATDQQRRQLERTGDILPAGLAQGPRGRYGTLDEAAAAVAFLASADAGSSPPTTSGSTGGSRRPSRCPTGDPSSAGACQMRTDRRSAAEPVSSGGETVPRASACRMLIPERDGHSTGAEEFAGRAAS